MDAFMWTVWAAFLSGIAVQGFRDETETPWRRGIGAMGCIFSLFMLSLTFDTELYTNVTWMFMGVVALGFGFAYFARLGEISTLFSEDFTDAQEAILEERDMGGEGDQDSTDEDASIEDETEQSDQEIFSTDENVEEEAEEETEEVIEQSEPETVLEDTDEELDEVVEDITEQAKEENVENLQPALDNEIKEVIDERQEAETEAAFEYDLLLDPSVSAAIQNSLASTPHEGFKPVVSVSSNGNLKIDFVPL